MKTQLDFRHHRADIVGDFLYNLDATNLDS